MPGPLIVGYDASSTLAPRTGIGRAALGLLGALVALEDPALELRVLLNSLTRRMGAEHTFLKDAARVQCVRRHRPGAALVRAWAAGKDPAAEDLAGRGMDVWHAVSSYVPPVRAARRVATVHDLAFLDEPPEQRAALGGALFAESFPRVLKECAAVVTPTEAMRQRVLDVYGLPPGRVHAIAWGIDPELFHVEAERFVEIVRNAFGIAAPTYLLAVSDHQPRKRNGLLLDVYARLREAEASTPPLVVLGWNGRPAAELKARPRLHRHVYVLPRVEDGKLAALYTGAVATVLASRDEGFGFPLLEAQACGSPVVASACGAFREMAGESASLVESPDPGEWVEALRAVAFDQTGHDAMKERGLANAARFTWDDCARRHREVYAGLGQ